MTLSVNEKACLDAARVECASAEVDWQVQEIMAFCEVESSFNPKALRYEPRIRDYSAGVMQTLLGTARNFGFKGKVTDLYVPITSIHWGIKVLDHYWEQLADAFGRDPDTAEYVAAYNMGASGVINFVRRWKGSATPDPKYVDAWQTAFDKWDKRLGSAQ